MPDVSEKKLYPYQEKSPVDLPGETWKEIPYFDGWFTISNLGRVKSLARVIECSNGVLRRKPEAIIRPAVFNSPNHFVGDFKIGLSITLNYQGQKKTFAVRRLVYDAFVAHIDLFNYDFNILCRDGNGLNMHYKNLELVTIAQKQGRIFSNHRSFSVFAELDMKAMAIRTASKRYRKITQYNLLGEKVAVHAGIVVAAKVTGINKSGIGGVLRGVHLKAGGYIWRYGKGADTVDLAGYWTDNRALMAKRQQKINTQYDLKGNRIAVYESLNAASKATGLSTGLISECLSGYLPKAGGYIWKFGSGLKKISEKDIKSHIDRFPSQSKPVAQYSPDNRFIARFDSIAQAAAAVGVHHSGVTAAVNGRQRYCAGFLWKFIKKKRP